MSGDHGDDRGTIQAARARALWLALALNGGFLVVELVGGIAFGSLALLADAAHMGSDVGALAISLIALAVAARPPSSRHTFGLKRAEVLGAQFNAIVLLAVALWIAVEAVRRFGEDVSIDGAGVALVAAIGLAINVGSAVLLARSAGRSLNMRGAFWHMMSDALGSVAALASGLAVILWDATWVDLVASLVVAVLVSVGGWRLLRDTTRVLLEGSPADLDIAKVAAALEADPSASAVHHLHAWSLDGENAALSAHVVLDDVPSLHDAQHVVDRLKRMLAERFGIEHATFEVECHNCETLPHHGVEEWQSPTRAHGSQ